jgi:hypothetical protein
MKLSLKPDLSTVAELSYWDVVMMLFGRELKVPGHPVHIRQQRAYEAFNISSPGQK